MTKADFQNAVFARIESLRSDMVDHIAAALDKNALIVYNVKKSQASSEWGRTVIADFGRRLDAVEKEMKSWFVAFLALQQKTAGLAAPLAITKLSDWQKETSDAVEKLNKELPALSSVPQVAMYFHVSYSQIRDAMMRGQLAIIREGKRIVVPRESVAEYVRCYGVPKQRKLFYGSAGVKEIPK
jgi:hypothetical protein